MATRHYCPSGVTHGGTYHCPGGDGAPGHGPKSGRCPGCGATLYRIEGRYGVFEHSDSARYDADEALALRETARAADIYRRRKDPAETRLVVRFVRDDLK